jgi:hypothetical protein
MTEQNNGLRYSDFQKLVLMLPQIYDLFLGGGRGGSKSYTIVLLILRFIWEYKNKARILVIRRTYKGLADIESLMLEVFRLVYGKDVKFNQAEHVFRFPNGAYLELGQLESEVDYSKYQGRSFTLLVVDEAQQYPTPELLDRLRSNLRGPKSMPIRQILAANPGGPGHHWLAHRYVFKAEPWQPFYEENSKRTWVYAPSTYLDNPFIDQDEYEEQIRASCPHDEELLKAWLSGDWSVARGAYFASVLEQSRNCIENWERLPVIPRYADSSGKWRFFLAHDFGSSAPSVTYLVGKSPGDFGPDEQYYPRDSLVLVDELATSVPGQPSQGLGWTVDRLADAIKDMWKRWGLKGRPTGCADDACFAKHGHNTGSIADEFKAHGVNFQRAQKGSRQYGWEVMRRLLADAGALDKPGLYIARRCGYFWETVPYLSRDPRNPEDLDSREPDHAADAVRYGCISRQREVKPVPSLIRKG